MYIYVINKKCLIFARIYGKAIKCSWHKNLKLLGSLIRTGRNCVNGVSDSHF